jgi:predicted  nucleic acid-binding Zn-ribbon protein
MANSFIGKIMSKITGGLDLLKGKQTRLISQRDSARSALEKAKAAVRTQRLDVDDTDDKTIAALQIKVDAAQSFLNGLDEDIEEHTKRVAAAQREHADKETKAKQKAESETITADVNKIESQIAPWLASGRKLASDLEKYGTFRFECGSIAKYLGNAANEIEIALSVSIPDLRAKRLRANRRRS